jgi:hypothetical protein
VSTDPALVSVVCVFNDAAVRADCLDRSVDRLRHQGLPVDYVPVDNTEGTFGSAGAALNHGIRSASAAHVVLVHQDVFLHSATALASAVRQLTEDPRPGVIGAVGINSHGRITGRIRDRACLIGEPAAEPREVDSLDEVFLLAARETLLEHPLTERPGLAWHAYAVEYGLRLRSLGRRVAAMDIPLTHNSLTTNLARLRQAHAVVAGLYPQALPVRTTCGRIDTAVPGAAARRPLLPNHRWRLRWLRATSHAHALRRACGGEVPVVLDDIRRTLDDVIAAAPGPFRVINLDPSHSFDDGHEAVTLSRLGHRIEFSAGAMASVLSRVGDLGPTETALITNLTVSGVADTLRSHGGVGTVLGLDDAIGIWLLVNRQGPVVCDAWRSPRARPLGIPPVAGAVGKH